MNTTQFLASLWGPVMLAIGIGMFTSRSYYTKIYRDLEQDAMAAFLFGIVAMTVGIAQIHAHNIWGSAPEVIVSLLGWSSLIKGATLTIAPAWADKVCARWAKRDLVAAIGTVVILLGAYLSYIAYLA